MFSYINLYKRHFLELLEGSEQVHEGAFFLGTNELGVELLVAGKGDATSSFVSITHKFVVGIVDLSNVSVGTTGDDILTVFIKTNGTITIDVNTLELVLNESLEHGRELSIALVDTVDLDSCLEFINIDFTVLVEISKEGDLVPQVIHNFAVGLEPGSREFTLSFKDGVPYSKALEVILVEDTIVVNVVEVPDNVSDAVIVSVSHGCCCC